MNLDEFAILKPANTPHEAEQVQLMIANGWRFLGVVPIKVGSKLSTPRNPEGNEQVVPHEIWAREMPTVPVSVLAESIIKAGKAYASDESKRALEDVCKDLFNASVDDLIEQSEKPQPPSPGKPSEEVH